MFLFWTPLDILWGFRHLWGWSDTGHIFGGENPQQSDHILNISFSFQVYCCGSEKPLCLWFPTIHQNLGARLNISLAKGLIQTGLCFGFLMSFMYSMTTPVSSATITLEILFKQSCCVTGWAFLVKFTQRQFYIKCGVSFPWLCK